MRMEPRRETAQAAPPHPPQPDHAPDPPPPRPPPATPLVQHPERGYTTAMTAFLLIPMMIFAGFAVDVGSLYTRAMEIQRAADAAALAGVVWMPGDFAAGRDAGDRDRPPATA